MCRVDGAEQFEVWQQSTPTARKEHTCCECGRPIHVGETYHRGRGMYESKWFAVAWCRHCDAASAWLRRECGGYLTEGLLEELVEHWEEDTAFRSVWLARAIAGMRQKWHGGRMPVPSEPPLVVSHA